MEPEDDPGSGLDCTPDVVRIGVSMRPSDGNRALYVRVIIAPSRPITSPCLSENAPNQKCCQSNVLR